MKFTQLRLSGFKSFVEPAELLIKDGLTGIVGPNGCGKSNLVEALRWVMGETSAKNMRGGAMDDVIFAGTTSRPARNMAEVTLGLDNSDKIAPPAYNENEELDVTRRIRRDTGSDYRINGKVSRARDVQLLFADLATGANSTAIVSQGRVGSLINAKPKDRRHLLEEAAGISGLHSRRHEAELRLRAAENNLERVDDVTGQLEVQLGSLKRQARQATRYRNISGHIRKAEAMLLFRKQEKAATAEATARQKLEEATFAVTELTRQVALAQTASLKASEILSPLRAQEAAAAAKVHRLTLERENLEKEEERLKKAQKQLEDRKLQITSDMEREKSLEKDAAIAIDQLNAEKKELHIKAEENEPRLEALRQRIQAGQLTTRTLQAEFDEKTEKRASEKAKHSSLSSQLEQSNKAIERLKARLKDSRTEKENLSKSIKELLEKSGFDEQIKQAQNDLETFTQQIEKIEQERQSADQNERSCRDQLREAEKETSATGAEIKALNSLLQTDTDSDWPAIVEKLKVKKGYEIALGAALGEDLDAPLDPDAPAFWQTLPPHAKGQAFPEGVSTLDEFVTGEPALMPRLQQIGIVDPADGEALSKSLHFGQRLVSKDGDLWRWDGFTRKSGAKTPAALRLEQRNRLEGLEKDLAAKQETATKTKDALNTAEAKLLGYRSSEKELRENRRQIEQTLSNLRSRQAEQTRTLATKQSRLTSLDETEAVLTEEITDAGKQQKSLAEEISALPDISAAQAKIEELRTGLREKREELGSIRSENDRILRESAIQRDRLVSIEKEISSWIMRNENMAEHYGQLEIRFTSTEEELERLTHQPEQLVQKRGQLMDEIARAEGGQSVARDQLAEAESVLKDCDAALRKCQDSLATCREERVRFEADTEHAVSDLTSLAEQIHEKLECTPDQIKAAGNIEEDEEIPAIDISERKLERLKKERDGMGPVNLRAEIEAKEVDEQLTTLLDERNDLEAAIGRLRQGISSLNKEGRERLLVAFKKVDSHFQDLFAQVFGGGHAHLTLTESEDPLAAGLEIMASPPGKKLQLMSLLSGGEQALTAVALLFAVFLTNPAPICVLDEVDAPLDDVNVDRLCNLLDSISQNSETRFLVVTHHPITMARMDRLFGVTMAERGISQLVSVDLAKAQLMTNETT